MNISTSKLLSLINNSESFEEATEYHRNHQEPTFPDELAAIMKKKRVTAKELIKISGIERSYFYHILGQKKNPGRNMVLRIAFSIQVSLEDTNRLLLLAGHAKLYSEIVRDAIMIYAIRKKMSIDEVNDLLVSEKQDPLFI